MWFRLSGELMQQVVERTEGTWVGDEDDAEIREPRRLHALPLGLRNRCVGWAIKFYAIPTLTETSFGGQIALLPLYLFFLKGVSHLLQQALECRVV